MANIYWWEATVAKDKDLGNGIVKAGEEVIIEFRGSDLTTITKPDGRRLLGHVSFKKDELVDFRIAEKETSDEEYRWYKDSTQHRYSLTLEEAESRRTRLLK